MAILSESEFEAVLSSMIRAIEKLIYAGAGDVKLQKINRQLQAVLDVMLDKEKDKPSPEQLKGLTEAAESLRGASLGDPKLEDASFEIEDYVTYRM